MSSVIEEHPFMPESTGHYLNRTEEECMAAGQTSICLGCKALGHPQGPSRKWGASLPPSGLFTETAVDQWRRENGIDPITGELC